MKKMCCFFFTLERSVAKSKYRDGFIRIGQKYLDKIYDLQIYH